MKASPLRSIALGIACGVSAVLVAGIFVCTPFFVEGSSMAPSLRPGSINILLRTAYTHANAKPEPGDVIVFIHPESEKTWAVKRVVAGAGDLVQIEPHGELFVNGKALAADAADQAGTEKSPSSPLSWGVRYSRRTSNSEASPKTQTTVPAGHVYVLGDNRGHSIDSRKYGPIKLSSVLGRVHSIAHP